MADPDFGTDLSCVDDLDPTMREVEGLELMGEANYRRLTTNRGSVIDAPDYGRDVRALLSRAQSPVEQAAIPGQLRAELLKDERNTDATVTVQKQDAQTQRLGVAVETGAGPFSLTVDVAGAEAALVEVQT